MTTGSYLHDSTVPFQCTTEDVNTGIIVNLTIKPVGGYTYRNWNGADRPKVPRTWNRIFWDEPTWYKATSSTNWKSVAKHRTHTKKVYVGAKGDSTPHNYHMYKQEYQYSRVDIRTFDGAGNLTNIEHTTFYGLRSPIGNASNYVDDNDRLALLGKLREKVAGSGFNLGVFLAEAGEAARMIGDTAIRISKALNYTRSGNLARAVGVLVSGTPRETRRPSKWHSKNVSGRWLELQYGWLPLLQDVYAGAEFLSKAMNFPYEQSYRVRKRKPLVYPSSEWNDDRKGSVDKLQLIAHIREVDIPQLVGLTDPASVAWEKLPWSFVADWFIPIGSYLSARSLSSSLAGTFITTYTSDERCVYRDNNKFILPDGPITMHYYYLDRQVSSSLSVPMPQVKSLMETASWRHCANAVALVTQKFLKG